MIAALCLLTCAVCAGEISDSLSFGDAKALKRHVFTGDGHKEALTGRVGTVDEKIPCWTSDGAFQVALKKSPNKTCALQIREAYPPESPGVRYAYEVYADDKLVYIRDYPGLMFGPVSYFINLDAPELAQKDKITLRFVNRREGSPFRITDIRLYSDFQGYCKSAGFDTPFYLAPLLKGGDDEVKLEDEFRYLKTNLRPILNSDVKLGCASEHHYMNRDAAASRTHFEQRLRLAKKYDMPFETIFVSWWGGTPMWHPDGKGGKFSDPEYQQICWSETDNYDEGEPLKTLLGDKWDIRYGWTTPNRWSNVPWLTMNHPRLNAARHKVIGEHLGILSDILRAPAFRGCDRYLLGIEMENEPRYWDLDCPDEKYPVKRENLWADFNPVTVEAAAKDGITLDPSDGLDYKERLWLHQNVARYQQETYDAHARALKQLKMPFINTGNDVLWHEVYSHAFPWSTFPMKQVAEYHPSLEWNRLKGCRSGLEDIPRDAAPYLDVTREWGRWSQVNYEENNGVGTDLHLRALRAAYAFGARFYIFYNWQSINREGRWTEYVKRFCEDGQRSLVCESTSTSHAFTVEIPSDWPAFNEVGLTVDEPGEYTLTVCDGSENGRVLGYRRKQVSSPGEVIFDLPNCIPTYLDRGLYIGVAREGGEFGLPKGFSLYMDSKRERTQSLLISWRADAEALISELKRKRKPGLETAERLFKSGDYRKAYEAAVRAETGLAN